MARCYSVWVNCSFNAVRTSVHVGLISLPPGVRLPLPQYAPRPIGRERAYEVRAVKVRILGGVLSQRLWNECPIATRDYEGSIPSAEFCSCPKDGNEPSKLEVVGSNPTGSAMDEDMKSYLEARGWHTWYNPNYWVNPKCVHDRTRQDYTNYGFPLEEAFAYEVEGRTPMMPSVFAGLMGSGAVLNNFGQE